MPPPPPPPGAPPPPSGGGGPPKLAVSKGGDRKNLLKDIQGGKKLKPTVTNDRSAPVIGNKPSASAGPSAPSGSRDDGGSSSSSSQSGATSAGPLPGIGGLFAGGMPTLKKTKGGVNTGRTTLNEAGK